MSKDKSGKKSDNKHNSGHKNNGHEAEIRVVHENVLETQHFPPVSETLKVTSENDKTSEVPKIEIISLKEKVVADSPKEEKEKTKISIVDLTQNRNDKNKKQSFNFKGNSFDSEKLLDALVLVGGGVIAASGFTSRAIASIGSTLIRK